MRTFHYRITKPAIVVLLIVIAAIVAVCTLHTAHANKGPYATAVNTAVKTASASAARTHPGTAVVASAPSQSAVASAVESDDAAVIVFTFDDGYVSDYNCAYRILKQYGIRGTSYIIGKYPDNNTPDTLSWAQIKEMKAYGWVFGCHTYTHTELTTLTDEEIKKEMEEENQAFTDQGLGAPEIMAYPSGKYNQHVIDIIKQYRKQARLAFYESKFVNLNNINPYEIDSISADMQETPRLTSREALVDKACAEHGIIVFRTHCMYFEKKNDNGCWDVQTDSRLFAALVKYCVKKGCRFVTMTELMDMYS